MDSVFHIDKPDKRGFDEVYQKKQHPLLFTTSPEDYIKHFTERYLTPFHKGGWVNDGQTLAFALANLDLSSSVLNRDRSMIRIIDIGSGLGTLSVYLACLGYHVVGIEISEEGCKAGEAMAAKLRLSDCSFLSKSIESTSLDDQWADFVIGYNSLHHFIKYAAVPAELKRIMKPGGQGFFVDPFGENPAYQLFHITKRKRMRRRGDFSLKKKMILEYFKDFEVEITPTSWFTMLDKLWIRVFGWRRSSFGRRLSHIYYPLDRIMPTSSRPFLFLSGRVITHIKVPEVGSTLSIN